MRHSRFAEPAAEATKRTAHAQVGQNGAQLFRGVGVGLGRDLAQLITAGRWQRHVLEHVLDVVLQQLVRTVALASLHVLHHQVGELLDVAGRAKHDVGRQRGGLDLKHALIQDEVLAPQAQHVVLDGATRRAEVEQASGAVVDLEHGTGHISRRNKGRAGRRQHYLERGHHEHAAAQQVLQSIGVDLQLVARVLAGVQGQLGAQGLHVLHQRHDLLLYIAPARRDEYTRAVERPREEKPKHGGPVPDPTLWRSAITGPRRTLDAPSFFICLTLAAAAVASARSLSSWSSVSGGGCVSAIVAEGDTANAVSSVNWARVHCSLSGPRPTTHPPTYR